MNESQASNEIQRLYAEQVRQIYKHAPIGIIANLVNSFILSFILWKVIPHSILIIWFSVIISISLLRYLLCFKYGHSSQARDDAGRWETLFLVTLTFSGVVWGSAGIFLFPIDSVAHQTFIAFVLGGMVAGAAGSFSVIIRIFLAFSLPALIPIIIRFFMIGDNIHLAMGGMILLFGLLMYSTAKRVNAVTISSLNLQFENRALINHLVVEKGRIEKLNKDYKLEIAERKHAQDELRKAKDSAEAANKAKTEFLANMSHELSTLT
jgi:signal transduction histidine kinase